MRGSQLVGLQLSRGQLDLARFGLDSGQRPHGLGGGGGVVVGGKGERVHDLHVCAALHSGSRGDHLRIALGVGVKPLRGHHAIGVGQTAEAELAVLLGTGDSPRRRVVDTGVAEEGRVAPQALVHRLDGVVTEVAGQRRGAERALGALDLAGGFHA